MGTLLTEEQNEEVEEVQVMESVEIDIEKQRVRPRGWLGECDKALVQCGGTERSGATGRGGAGRSGAANNNGSKSTLLRFARDLIKRSSHVWARSHGPETLGHALTPIDAGPQTQRSWTLRFQRHEPQLHVTLYQKPSPSPRDTGRRRADTQNR